MLVVKKCKFGDEKINPLLYVKRFDSVVLPPFIFLHLTKTPKNAISYRY